MAISSGVAPHTAFISVSGGQFPIEHGSVDQTGTKKTATFSADIPLSYPGAEAAFSSLGENTASIIVSSVAGSGTLVTGEIDNVDIDYVGRTIAVTGRDQSAKLHETKSAEKWTNKKGSDIVQDLAGRAGLGVMADASTLLAGKLVQIDWARISDNISFASIIHKLAELDGARWFVKNGTLYYQSQDAPQGTYSVNYSPPTPDSPMMGDFIALKIERNIQAGKNINVTVKSWNPKQKQAFTGTGNVSGNGGPQNYVYHIPNLDQDHVTKHAKAKAAEVGRHAVTVNATLIGDPSLDPSMDLVVNGTGYFDNSYPIDSVHHDFGMVGYTMDVVAKTKATAS